MSYKAVKLSGIKTVCIPSGRALHDISVITTELKEVTNIQVTINFFQIILLHFT